MPCWFASLEVSNSAVPGTLGQPSCASMWPPGCSSLSALCRLHHKEGILNRVFGGSHRMLIHHKISPSQMIKSCPQEFMPWDKHHSSCSIFPGMPTSGIRTVCGTDHWKKGQRRGRQRVWVWEGSTTLLPHTATLFSPQGRDHHICLCTAVRPHLA